MSGATTTRRLTSGRGLRLVGVLASTLVGAAACERSPIANAGGPAPEVLSSTVLSDGAGIFRSLSVQLDREGTLVADYWSADGERLQVGSAARSTTHRPGGRAETCSCRCSGFTRCFRFRRTGDAWSGGWEGPRAASAA